MSDIMTLDEKFTEVIKKDEVNNWFASANITDNVQKLAVLRKLFVRSGYEVAEMVAAMKDLVAGRPTGFLDKRVDNLVAKQATDANSQKTVEFILAISPTGHYADIINSQEAPTTEEKAQPSYTFEAVSDEEDLTDMIIEVCSNSSKIVMPLVKMGYSTHQQIRDYLLSHYIRS